MKRLAVAFLSLAACASAQFSTSPVSVPGAISSSELLGTSTNIRALRAALDGSYATPVSIVYIGDSITQGTGSTTITNSWTARVNAALQAAYANGGQGFCGILNSTANASGCTVATVGVWTAVQGFGVSQTVSPAFGSVQSNGASGTGTTTFQPGGDTIDFYCGESTDSAAGFTMTIDGAGVAAACAANVGTNAIIKVSYTGLDAKKPHTIVATAPASGKGYFFGWSSHLSTGGVTMINVGQSGADSSSVGATGKVAWLGAIANLGAIVVELGQNDADKTGATLVANLASLQAKAAALSVPIIYLISENDSSNNTLTWGPAAKSWAAANSYDWISVADYWGTYAQGNALGLYADTVHPSPSGQYSIANLFLNQMRLTPPTAANPAPQPVRALQVTTPASDIICAHPGDSINSLTCTNSGDAGGAYQNFATTWSQPQNLWAAGRVVQICGQFEYWSTATSPTYLIQLLLNGATQLFAPSGALAPGTGKTANGFSTCWTLFATDTGSHVYTQPVNYLVLPTTSAASQAANGIAQPKSFGAGNAATVAIGIQYSATGIASGTYTSGITATGTVGQTCALTVFNNGNASGTATVALTGTNTIAGSTALVITNTGTSSTSAATSATAGNGTATCSGTATVATVLGGAQGNAVWLQALTVTQLN